jgi:hypothetical protein
MPSQLVSLSTTIALCEKQYDRQYKGDRIGIVEPTADRTNERDTTGERRRPTTRALQPIRITTRLATTGVTDV